MLLVNGIVPIAHLAKTNPEIMFSGENMSIKLETSFVEETLTEATKAELHKLTVHVRTKQVDRGEAQG